MLSGIPRAVINIANLCVDIVRTSSVWDVLCLCVGVYVHPDHVAAEPFCIRVLVLYGAGITVARRDTKLLKARNSMQMKY